MNDKAFFYATDAERTDIEIITDHDQVWLSVHLSDPQPTLDGLLVTGYAWPLTAGAAAELGERLISASAELVSQYFGYGA